MPDRTHACASCGAPAPARRLAVLEIELDELDDRADGLEVALDRVPARIRRRLPSGRRRRAVGVAAGVIALAAVTVNALAGDPGRPAVLPARATASAPVTVPAGAAVPAPTGLLFGETTGLRLVVLAAPDLAAVDLDTGRAVTLDTDLVARSTGAPAVATSMGLAFVDRDGGASLLTPGASTSRSVLAPSAGARVTTVLGEGPAGRLWVVVDDGDVGTVDLTGTGTFEPVGTVPAGAIVRADGAGGAVVGAPGGVYRLVPGRSATRLTGGVLLDARAGRVLSLECDDALTCAGQVLDLADGARWRVPVPAGADPATMGLAPDGTGVVRSVPDPGGASATVDLVGRDGTVVPLGATTLTCDDAPCRPSLAWSPDGRWLVGATPGGDLWGWRSGLAGPVVSPAPSRDGRPLAVAVIVALTTSGAAPA